MPPEGQGRGKASLASAAHQVPHGLRLRGCQPLSGPVAVTPPSSHLVQPGRHREQGRWGPQQHRGPTPGLYLNRAERVLSETPKHSDSGRLLRALSLKTDGAGSS